MHIRLNNLHVFIIFVPINKKHIKMRKLLLSAAAMTLLFTACKKDDDNGTGNGLGTNEWKIGATTYKPITAQTVIGASGVLTASGMNGTQSGTFTTYFNNATFPTTGGQFKIVDNPDAADEILINVITSDMGSNAKTYGSTAGTTATATVTVTNGKITISVPEITVTGTDGSTTFAGNATQY
jgi:hypothetical protein